MSDTSSAIALRVPALLDVVRRNGATAETVATMSLLDRRLAAQLAGITNATDGEWTQVAQALRAAEAAGPGLIGRSHGNHR